MSLMFCNSKEAVREISLISTTNSKGRWNCNCCTCDPIAQKMIDTRQEMTHIQRPETNKLFRNRWRYRVYKSSSCEFSPGKYKEIAVLYYCSPVLLFNYVGGCPRELCSFRYIHIWLLGINKKFYYFRKLNHALEFARRFFYYPGFGKHPYFLRRLSGTKCSHRRSVLKIWIDLILWVLEWLLN